MIGSMKLPRTAGIDGIRKKNTMITPCIVNSLLYVSGCTKSAAGVTSSRRIIIAKKPPMAKNAVTDTRYSSAIRLWSRVSSHDARPWALFR